MADPTVNPYGFVPLAGGAPDREKAPDWHRIAEGACGGTLVCELEALGPLFTADHQRAAPVEGRKGQRIFPFLKNGAGRPILQGTSLKGMIRAVYEASYPSCLPLAAAKGISKKAGRDTPYDLTIPSPLLHSSCVKDSLCPACRLFGVIQGDEVHLRGRVAFSDAVFEGTSLETGTILLRELSSPKPHHYAIYSATEAAGGAIRGRKIYLHQDQPAPAAATETGDPAWSTRSSALSEHAPAGARFRFRIVVENLTEIELSQLIACLELDEEHAHKIGMAKPLGFGSCRIRILREESRIYRGPGRYLGLGATPATLPAADWQPVPGELGALLRRDLHRGEAIGYLPFAAYRGKGIEASGRYKSVGVKSAPAPAPPPIGEQRPAAALVRVGDLGLRPEGAPQARRQPAAQPIKKNEQVKVRVVEVLGPGHFLLQVVGREQPAVEFEGSVGWKVGDVRIARAAVVVGGDVEQVKWP